MNLKKMWKQTNRGIVIGGVLIIGVMVYTKIDNTIFEKEAPSIEKAFRDYANEFIAVNVDDNTSVTSDQESTKELVKAKENRYNKVLDKYWTTKEYSLMNQNGFLINKPNIMETIHEGCNNVDFMSSRISKINTELSYVDVKKSGPNGAMVECRAETECSFYGPVSFYLLDGQCILPSDWGFAQDYSNNVKEQKEETCKLTTFYTLYYIRDNGEWKISGAIDTGSELDQSCIPNAETQHQDTEVDKESTEVDLESLEGE